MPFDYWRWLYFALTLAPPPPTANISIAAFVCDQSLSLYIILSCYCLASEVLLTFFLFRYTMWPWCIFFNIKFVYPGYLCTDKEHFFIQECPLKQLDAIYRTVLCWIFCFRGDRSVYSFVCNKKLCYSEKSNNYSPKHSKIEASGTPNTGEKKKNQADQRTKGTPSFLFADLEWAESQISTLPHTRMSWTKEILTRKYEPEHAKFRNTVRGGQIMARHWYIWTATFPSFVN